VELANPGSPKKDVKRQEQEDRNTFTTTSTTTTTTTTKIHPFYAPPLDFVWDYPGKPVPER